MVHLLIYSNNFHFFGSVQSLFIPCWYALLYKIGGDLFIIIPHILMVVINHVVTYARPDGQCKNKKGIKCVIFPLYTFNYTFIFMNIVISFYKLI